MLDQDITACPVFTRWQVQCPKCGITFYIDSEPESVKNEILKLKEIKCEYHPKEDSVVMLV